MENKFTASMISSFLGGVVQNPSDTEVVTIASVDKATITDLSFILNKEDLDYVRQGGFNGGIVITDYADLSVKNTVVVVDNVKEAFDKISELYGAYIHSMNEGVASTAIVSKSAVIADDVYIGHYAYIGDNVIIKKGSKIYPNSYIGDGTVIGEDTIIYPGVTIYYGTIIGNRVTIFSNTVLGADGFGFALQEDLSFKKIPQLGVVIIEDDVFIGANTCIDRATMGNTTVSKGAKLSNQIQVAHNVVIGENNVLHSHVGISGSTKLGENCFLESHASLSGHLNIPAGTMVYASSGVSSLIGLKEGNALIGNPAWSIRQFNQNNESLEKLDSINNSLNERMNSLEKELEELKSQF